MQVRGTVLNEGAELADFQTGIAWLAVEGNPILFQWTGLGLAPR